MASTVVAVHVERLGLGRARIDRKKFRQLVDDAVRPIREGKSDLADIPYEELAQTRRKAVRSHVLSLLQQEGELFPTE